MSAAPFSLGLRSTGTKLFRPSVGGWRADAVCFTRGKQSTREMRCIPVAADYDEVRSDVRESQDTSLEALRTANAPDALSVVRELDESDTVEGIELPGDFIAEELIVEVIPQADDEFTCWSCFLVRHRSQVAREKDGHAYCIECEG